MVNTKIQQHDIDGTIRTTAGTSTAYTVTIPGRDMTEAFSVFIKIHTDSGAAPTLNPNATANCAIKDAQGNNLAAGDLQQDVVYEFIWDPASSFFFSKLVPSGAPAGSPGYLDATDPLNIYLLSAGDRSASDIGQGGYAIVNGTNFLFAVASFYGAQNVSGGDEHIFLSVYALEKATGKIKIGYGFAQIDQLLSALGVDDTLGNIKIDANVGGSLYYEFANNAVTQVNPGGTYAAVGFDTFESPVPDGATYAAGTLTVATDTYGGHTYEIIRTSVEIDASAAWAFAVLRIS